MIPRAPTPRLALRWILLLGALVITGCARRDEVGLGGWQLLHDGAPARAITLPVHLDRDLSPSPQIYHLRTTAELPTSLRGQPVALVIPHLWALVALEVDGRPIAPDRRAWFTVYRTAGPQVFWIPAEQTLAASLDLHLEVRHEWTQSGWLDTIPYLTRDPSASPSYVVKRSIDGGVSLFGAGAVFAIAFGYFVLYLLDRRRTAHLWFALQGWTAVPYCIFNVGATQALFGRYDAPATLFSLVITILTSVHFTRKQFNLPAPGRVWIALTALALAAALARPGPFGVTGLLAPIAVFIIVLGVSNQVLIVGRLVLLPSPPRNARIALAAWLVVALVSASDLAAWLGLGEALGGVRCGGIGITTFALLQSVAMGRDFMSSLRESEQLNERLRHHVTELDEQHAEVRNLNEELRRQVLARSEQLSEALTRLATAQGESVVLQEGDVVDGLYHIVRPIGAGGMGVVYEVRRDGDDAHFALKVLSGLTGIHELARFAREGKLAAAVSHANVVRIYDTSVSKKGFLFLLLELVDGQPLNRRRERYGDVPWALDVLGGIARGLAAIHAQGIVHRDMKPGNVLVREDASGAARDVKITDFGISNTAMPASTSSSNSAPSSSTGSSSPRAASGSVEGEAPTVMTVTPARSATPSDGEDPDTADWQLEPGLAAGPTATERDAPAPLTKAGVLLGTPVYMAPEILRGSRRAMTPADIYALGVIAFELLCGKRPFTEEEALARAASVSVAKPPSLLGCGIPAPLAALLDAALDVDPEARPTAAMIVGALTSPATRVP
ncbi:MAG: serine/threonine-protein kinase [Byssovorax sp.]